MLEFLYVRAFWLGVGLGAVLIAVGYGAWRRSVFVYRLEGQIPQVLRVFSDAAAAGLDMRSALEVAAQLGVRPMADVLRRVLSLAEVGGLTVEEALWRMAGELPSANFRRFALIITEGVRSGARLPEVLDVAARSFATVVEFRSSLLSQLRPYVALFYAVLLVFAALADVLVYFLLPELAKFSAASAGPIQGIQPAVVSRDLAIRVLYISGIANSVVGGAVVGRLVSGSARAGMVHGGAGVIMVGVGLWAPMWLGF
ncbi:type II secretion system F family protein [Pyrobaculum ferrireducens]|uniref:type II secretion system F family protein n=1 Tax=Pyrobaculum ferrireducens TaxID=1104324 RepID=UPI000A8C8AF3|nr:type II secretion system F family protein [Pyrobaculum ferrireducens]